MRRDAGQTAAEAPGSGMYWARWEEVPEGGWVSLWLSEDRGRLRGSYELPPWHGELIGVRREADTLHTVWHEEGLVAVRQARSRRLDLRWDGALGAYRAEGVILRRARALDPALRPGLWLARWTGLPPGMVVETQLTRRRDPDGAARWLAVYQYQGRAGQFEGTLDARGRLPIVWQELSTRDSVSRGHGLLIASDLGLRGEYGMNEESSGVGAWQLEPAPW